MVVWERAYLSGFYNSVQLALTGKDKWNYAIPHAILVLLNEFLLVLLVLHPVFARNDEIGRDPAFWARPGKTPEVPDEMVTNACASLGLSRDHVQH